MTKEGVVPEFLIDEITPPPREHPNDWILNISGQFYMADEDASQFDEEAFHGPLIDGQIYSFERLKCFGDATLTINDDKSDVVNRDMPKAAESVFMPMDPDTLSGSVDELVRNCGEDLGLGDHSVEYFSWRSERWRFDATNGVFVEVIDEGDRL